MVKENHKEDYDLMSTKVEKLENSMVKLTIEVDEVAFEKGMVFAYNKVKKDIAIQGFRKGKAPRKMIEKIYGSSVFYEDSYEKIELKIILDSHSLEKGLLHKEFRYKYGQKRVKDLISNLNTDYIDNNNNSQLLAAYQVLCDYYDIHKKNNEDISLYFNELDYTKFKKILIKEGFNKHSIIDYSNNELFEKSNSNFYAFSMSRKSVRHYTGEAISLDVIDKVIELTKYAPSVCNRQPNSIYYLDDKNKIDKLLDLQEGFSGFTDNVSQILVVVSDVSYFSTIGERNQMYVDGGIFLMNLLYSLHYYKIGACTANWSKEYNVDRAGNKLLNLSGQKKIIAIVPIGVVNDKVRVTLSLRRSIDEILFKV